MSRSCLSLRRHEDRHLGHVLDDRPVSNGDVLEVLLGDGHWVRGRFDWSGLESRWPVLRIALGSLESQRSRVTTPILLRPEAVVRWTAPEAALSPSGSDPQR